MAEITNGEVLTDIQFEVPTARGEHEPALNGRRPDDPAIHHTLDMMKDRIPIVASAGHGCVCARPKHKCIWSIAAREAQLADGLRHSVRIALYAARKCHNGIAAAFADALNSGRSISIENGAIFGKCDLPRRLLDGRPVRIRCTALYVIDRLSRKFERDT